MKKLIITTGCAPGEEWRKVLDISVPRFKKYAARHGYEFKTIWYTDISHDRFPEFRDPRMFIDGAVNYEGRHDFIRWKLDRSMLAPNWLRYAAILQLLDEYDLIVYFDSDVVIADFETDVADGFPAEKWIANAVPQNENGGGPSGCLYMTRSCQESKTFWQRIWAGQKWKQHSLWTDGVDYMDALGYSLLPPVRKIRSSEYDAAWWQIGDEWARYWNSSGQKAKAYHIAGGFPPAQKAAAMQALIAMMKI